eukprot:m.17526 g.17526  ORF g.17526 m.17526 type:complete len:134 (-) comp3593_c0_seq1:190-591(-)
MPVTCVAVIGPKNNPLYFRTASEDVLRFQFLVHSALDVVDEKVASLGKSGADQFLGLLSSADDMRVYGYMTQTKYKFVVVVDDVSTARDNEIRAMFRRIHELYMVAISNPFHTYGEKIESKKFDGGIRAIMGV